MIFLEPKRQYHADKAELDESATPDPLFSSRVVRQGSDVTVLAYGPTVKTALKAAEAAAGEGRSLEVIDLRTLSPLDLRPVFDSVRRTGRAVVTHEAHVNLGLGAEVAARVTEECFYSLEAPVLRVGAFDTPYPRVADRGGLPARPRPRARRRRPHARLLRRTPMAEFKLPDVGEGLTEAEIVTWKVKVGDTVEINDIVVEIETAKSLVELPSPFAGIVQQLLVAEGETVPVGTPIIAIGDTALRRRSSLSRPPSRPSRTPTSAWPRRPVRPRSVGRHRPVQPGGQRWRRGRSRWSVATRPTGAPYAAHATPPFPTRRAPRPRSSSSRARSSPVSRRPTWSTYPTSRPCPRRPAPVVARGRPAAGQAAGAQAGQGPRRRPRRAGRVRPERHGHPRRRARRAGGPTSRSRPVDRRTTSPPAQRETREPIKGVRKMMGQAMVGSAFTIPHVTEWVTIDVDAHDGVRRPAQGPPRVPRREGLAAAGARPRRACWRCAERPGDQLVVGRRGAGGRLQALRQPRHRRRHPARARRTQHQGRRAALAARPGRGAQPADRDRTRRAGRSRPR